MVIVIPLALTHRLEQIAAECHLNLPVPLTSRCASYLSPAELDTIVTALQPLASNEVSATNLLAELQSYRAQAAPVVPCESR